MASSSSYDNHWVNIEFIIPFDKFFEINNMIDIESSSIQYNITSSRQFTHNDDITNYLSQMCREISLFAVDENVSSSFYTLITVQQDLYRINPNNKTHICKANPLATHDGYLIINIQASIYSPGTVTIGEITINGDDTHAGWSGIPTIFDDIPTFEALQNAINNSEIFNNNFTNIYKHIIGSEHPQHLNVIVNRGRYL